MTRVQGFACGELSYWYADGKLVAVARKIAARADLILDQARSAAPSPDALDARGRSALPLHFML
jgi:hypothetical protein